MPGSRYTAPFRVIPHRGQISENGSKPPNIESCDVFHDDESRSKLAHDSGDAPGSRYGTYARDWAPVAAALIVCFEYASGESYRTEDGELDHDLCNGLVSLVVNDSPEPADIIREYGPIVGLDPFDFIDEDEVEDA